MKITKKAITFGDSEMVMEADGGDFLPSRIKIIHNEKSTEYNQQDTQPVQSCPNCNNTVNIMPANPLWDYPGAAVTTETGFAVSGTVNFSDTQPIVETKRTYKCVNPKCWVTKIRVEWE